MARANSQPPELKGFRYLRQLGSGGFSDVYLYEQALPKRSVAVKVLDELTADNRASFAAEANLMAQLSAHPYIVSIHHADVSDDGRPFFIMEYCSGPSLADRYKRQPLSVAEALRVGIHIASAVATEEPQMAANSVQDTTVTMPSAPRIRPNQAIATPTSAFATPPRRMNAAAITNSGSAIKVDEFSSSAIFCAITTIGWPLT